MAVIYSARWVLPISSPPIHNGAIAIEGPLILAVGSESDLEKRYPDAPVNHFGEAAILPGLVNSHSHLELTVMRGFLEKEEADFFAWLRKLTIARLAMTAEDLFVAATLGAIEATRAGITCLGDSSSFAQQPMRALKELGLRGIVYQESFGPDPRLAEENTQKLSAQFGELRMAETNLVKAGVSPHAPYTVSGPQLELISRLAIEQKAPVMMHAAESLAEQMFLTDGTGPFADGLKQRGIEWQAPRVSTIEYLRQHGVLETRPLLAHCVNANEADLSLIKNASAGIAHCPKSNAKLRHGPAPFAEFIRQGISVGLGSDSVASNNNCDILEEARFAILTARNCATDVTAEQALFAATSGGAKAMQLDHLIGSLGPRMQADITVIDLGRAHQQPLSDPAGTIVFSSSGRDVILTMVAGEEIYRAGRMATIDENYFISRVQEIRSRLEASSG